MRKKKKKKKNQKKRTKYIRLHKNFNKILLVWPKNYSYLQKVNNFMYLHQNNQNFN